MPRVWWTDSALRDITAGKTVAAVYSRTAMELSANALFYWLQNHSANFGWQPMANLDEAQNLANGGRPVVICARHKNPAASGHITVIVPESDRMKAVRSPEGHVVYPVQSQAGAKCYNLSTKPDGWWAWPQFAESGLWGHVGELLNPDE